jgi:hypothetical protein
MSGVNLRRFVVLLSLALIVPGVSFGATFEVVTTTDTDCSDGTCDFQSALTAAASNGEDDVINLPDTSDLTGGWIATTTTFDYTAGGGSNLVINGSESGRTALYGNDSVRILSIELTSGSASDPAEITISNVTFHNGHSGGSDGGGLAIFVRHGDVTVEGCSFIANDGSMANGGGAWLGLADFGSGSATVRNSTFADNSAVNGAGLWVGFPNATIEDNGFYNNVLTDTGSGGGAHIAGTSGTIMVRGNTFQRNSIADGVEDCQGGGLYLSSGGFEQTTVERNTFERNLLGHNGSGAGAYVSRVDGPLIIEANEFHGNWVGGTVEDMGGGGLTVSLFGSFAEGTVINNAFVGNRTRSQGIAAQLYSMDGEILFANNTAVGNFVHGVIHDLASAVFIDAPAAHLFNNIIMRNPDTIDLLVHDGFSTETVTLRNNDISDYVLPAVVNLDAGNNINVDPDFIDHQSIHLGAPTSPAVDAGTTYTGMPTTDIDGEARVINGDGAEVVDIGADEFGGLPVLEPGFKMLRARESDYMAGVVQKEHERFSLTNIGAEPIQITDVSLETVSPDWGLVTDSIGEFLDPRDPPWIAVVVFKGISRHDSSNTLTVETTGGSVSANIFGDFESLSHSDGDGVSDEIEGVGYDGNCDEVPDSEQDHVVSLLVEIGVRATIVAPIGSAGKIGTQGEFFTTVTPLFTDVSTWPAPDEGGGPTSHGYRGDFFSFDITTDRGHLYTGDYPISIILPNFDSWEIDGYVKCGPTPDDFPPSLVTSGCYDFVYDRLSRDYPELGRVGAVIENDVSLCDGEDHQVVHLRLRDGLLGDADFVADGYLRDPGGPAIMPEGFWDDDDDEIVRIFPGTASAPGKDDAFFVTDVRLYNPDPAEAITVHLSFLDRDADNSGATELPVEIPPRQAVAYNDVLASLFGLSNAAGAIRMRSPSLFYATSRTYNEGGPDGTFGSFCPGLSPEDALEDGILLQVANNPADSGFRANVGFANPGLIPVDVTVSVYNADTGELIGSKDRELLPRTFSQINNVLKFVGKRNLVLTNAAVEFTATAPVLAYTTVIDNTSDDPIFVLPFADEGTPLLAAGALSVKSRSEAAAVSSEVVRIFPGTASAPGKDDAFFVTDVRLYNPDPDDTITVYLSFLDRDANNNGATELPVEISPRQAAAYDDVLASLFGLSNAAGAIRMRSSSLFYATSRTYNEGGPDGTFGSFCPGLSPDDALTRGILLQVANDPADTGFRSNVGFANPGLSSVDVTVRVYNADTGELIGTKERELKPRTFSQINNVLKFVGKRNLVLSNVAVEFTATAPVLAYTTVIDNTSDDPIFVLPFADTGTVQ